MITICKEKQKYGHKKKPQTYYRSKPKTIKQNNYQTKKHKHFFAYNFVPLHGCPTLKVFSVYVNLFQIYNSCLVICINSLLHF